jgi:hypothetical protein
MDTPFFEHAANHLGHPVLPIPPVYDPEEVIEAIVELARNPVDEVVVGRRGKVASAAGKIMPGTIERQMAKKVHGRLMRQSETEGPSTGALFSPMRSGTDVRGGWREGQSGAGKVGKIALGAALPIAGLLIARQVRQRRNEIRQAA